jgi:hypothetical protein
MTSPKVWQTLYRSVAILQGLNLRLGCGCRPAHPVVLSIVEYRIMAGGGADRIRQIKPAFHARSSDFIGRSKSSNAVRRRCYCTAAHPHSR